MSKFSFGGPKPLKSSWNEDKLRQALGKVSVKKNKPKKVSAQELLDAVSGTAQEKEVIAFLKSQGIEVK